MSPQFAPPIPTESEFKLLKLVARRSGTGCPFNLLELPLLSEDRTAAIDMRSAKWVHVDTSGGVFIEPAGTQALSRGIATKPCFSDSCTEIFEFEYDEGEDYGFCSEYCEAEQRARDAGDWLHDAAKEGG